MKKIVLAAAMLFAATPVWAADLARAPASPAAVPLWQGFYAGIQFGYGADPDGLTPGALPSGFSPIFSGTLAGMPQGFTAGGRAGYDFQAGTIVWGIESDLSWADFKRSGNEILYGGVGGVSWNEKTNWWGSTNLRLGVPFLSNQALVYALGGVAYGNRTIDAAGFVGPFSTQGSFGGTSVDWDVGGGLAAKIGSSGEVLVEGRWVNLGTMSGQLTLTIPGEVFVAGASQNFGFAIA